MSAQLGELAEDAYAYLGGRPWQQLLATDRFVAVHGPTQHALGGIATRVRFGDDFADGVSSVKAWFRDRGRDAFVWSIGPSTTPGDIGARLSEAGAVPMPGFETASCMVLTDAPPATHDVEVRELTTLEEYERGADLSAEAFAWGDEHRDAQKATLRAHWEARDPTQRATFGAFVDDQLVAIGISSYTDRGVYLDGGATLPQARGRGAYSALVAARWVDAVRRGTPALVVQAGPMSAPILERLGFESVATVEFLRDSSDPR
ncbi:MAG: acetyltransferase [Actinomycetia bacterium]|nr:acetyltransferase [Actinomycetes bacterium]